MKARIPWFRVFVKGVVIVGSILLAFFGAAATEIVAEEPFVFERGVRLRVTAPDCELRGQATGFQALRAGTLVLEITECPLASVTRLDVSRGQKSNTILGAGIGFAAGALGAVVYCSTVKYEFSDQGKCVVFGDDTTPYQALIFGGLGGLVGGITGYLIKTERWEEIPLERLRVSLTPQRDGRFALGFSVRF